MSKRTHCFSDDIMGNLDGVALAKLIKEGKINATELVEATITRAAEVDPKIKAIVFRNDDRARTKAKEKINGFFAGVPIYFKELTTLKDIPIYFGSEAFEGAKPGLENDALAQQVLSMGFINMGTSTMPEFGFTCSTEFPNLKNTINPWNDQYSAGGSSGGAAALVAAGVIPIAHAADGGGSTRIPSACCGLVGLKPSRGRLLMSKSFEKQLVEIAIDGVITRTVRDTAYFYHEAEKIYRNKKLPAIGLVDQGTEKKLKIGFIEEALSGDLVDQATQKHFQKTINLLENLGHHLVPIKFPVTEQMIDDFKLLWASNGFGVKHLGRFVLPKPFDATKLTPLTHGLSSYYLKRIFRTPFMWRRLKKTPENYQQFLDQNKIDIMLTPTLSHLTPRIGHLGTQVDFETLFSRMAKWACFTPYANANGAPSLSLPICHDNENDLPVGMLFNAGLGNDRLLLELAYQIEAAQPWKKIYE